MGGYIRVLLKEFYTEIKLEILECHKMTQMDDALLEKLLRDDGGDSYED
jgi:hypothetical protein